MNLNEQATQPTDLSYRLIPLTQGKFAKVDASDFDWLSQWKWFASWNKNAFYASRHACEDSGIRHTVAMGRLILGLRKGDIRKADHISGDTLDNTRANLRIATTMQNGFNRGPQCDNTSGYRGVRWQKDKSRWRAIITVAGKTMHLGYFRDIGAAAHAYRTAAQKHYGDFYRESAPKNQSRLEQ